MWWTKTFDTLEKVTQFLNDNKIEKMQVIYDTRCNYNTARYKVIYYTESY